MHTFNNDPLSGYCVNILKIKVNSERFEQKVYERMLSEQIPNKYALTGHCAIFKTI